MMNGNNFSQNCKLNNVSKPPQQNSGNRPIIPLPPKDACAVFLTLKKEQIKNEYPQLNS